MTTQSIPRATEAQQVSEEQIHFQDRQVGEPAIPGIEVRELFTTEDAAKVMSIKCPLCGGSLSARAENKRRQEDAALAADLAYQSLKDSGQLHRMEAHRALVAQVTFGDAL